MRYSFVRSLVERVALTSLIWIAMAMLPSHAAVVWTQHNDNSRSGQNTSETTLTPANVNQTQFGKIFNTVLDDESYSQPLYIPSLGIAGGTHNTVFVTTVNNSVYAIEADTGAVLWHVNLTPSGLRPPKISDASSEGACGGAYADFSGNYGIVGTPVIDTGTNTLYVVSRDVNGSTFTQRLHALDITTGGEKFAGPVVISGANFSPSLNNQRPALTLLNGVVYIAWSSHCDNGAYHGIIMGYNASNLAQNSVWNDTNGGSQAGIWMGGQGLTVDGSGNLYVMTGNGSWDGANNFGESFVKLSSTLGVLDYFTPNNWNNLNGGDTDLGAAGSLGIPGTSLIFGGGKQGMVYLLNTASLGHENATDNVVQEFQATFPTSGNTGHIHGGPVYWSGPAQYIYLWGENDFLRAYQFNGSTLNSTATATSTMRAPVSNSGMPGGFLSVSANGTSNGIIWALTPYNGNANNAVVQGILHAFNASPSGSTLTELWNSKQNTARDDFGNFAKFTYPTIANGKVYIATFGTASSGAGQLWAYGQISSTVNGPVAINAGGSATGSFVADADFSGGTVATPVTNAIDTTAVTNPAPQAVYQTERYGNMTYTIPGLTSGASYTVRLHMAENYWTAAGSRSFNVIINGSQVLTNFDVFAAAGAQHKANIQQFTTTANGSGQVVIQFVTVTDNALIDGIEIIAAGASCTASPSAPTGLAASGTTTTSTNLSWGAVTPPANCSITSYTVFKNGTSIGTATGTTFAVTGLSASTTYTFTIAASDSHGMSVQSTGLNVTTGSASCAASPSAPGAPTASGTTSTSTNLSWTAVTPPANCSITSYTVFKNGTSIGTSASTSFAVTGLSASTTYTFTIAATDSFGTSGQSAGLNVTTSSSTTGGGGGIQIACGNTAQGTFVADTDFSGGAASSGTTTTINTTAVANPAPMSVWQHGRKGTCTYTIPGLTVGASYSVKLDFCEYAATGAGQRTFNVSINGTQVLTNFDIFATAGAEFKANQQSFTATANASGQVVIVFTTVLNNALVAGIEVAAASGSIAPGLHTLTPQNATATRLDDLNSGTANGNAIDISAATGAANQSWNFATTGVVPAGDWNIAVNLGAFCLASSGTTSGSAAEIWACNGAANESWQATKVGAVYQLAPSNATGLCLNVSGNGTANGTPVIVWTCSTATNSLWAVN